MRKPMLKGKTLRYTFRCAIGLGIVIALAAFAPSIVAFGWHLTHAAKQDYAGYQITIPPGSFLHRSSNEIEIFHARTIFSTNFYRISEIIVQAMGRSADLSRFDTVISKDFAQRGKPLPVLFRTTVGGTPLACSQEKENSYWSVSCLSADGLSIVYVGDFEGIWELHSILEGARKL
jgi:hypothetical protein